MSPRDYDDLPLDRETPEDSRAGRPFGSQPEERSRGGRWVVMLVILALVGAGVWYLVRRETPATPPAPTAAETAPAPAAPEAAPAPTERAFVLPSLEASDPLIRELVAGLSTQPRLVRWLANENLVRRFVATVDNLAEGTSPTTHLRPLGPEGAFKIARPRADAAPVVDVASFERYDSLVDAFVALPDANVARLYRELRPLFDKAYAELGYPGRSFDERLAEAMGRMLAVEVPAGPVEVKLKVITYEFMDPDLEGRSAAAKHLMRLGPDNARKVQSKLREIAAAIGVVPR